MTTRLNVFHTDHVGQKVNCRVNGNGKITDNFSPQPPNYPCEVTFQCGLVLNFTACGRLLSGDKYPSLSFTHKHTMEWNYSTPSRIYVPLQFTGNPIWCSVGGTEEHAITFTDIHQVIAKCKGGVYLAIKEGRKNTESVDVLVHYYAMELNEEELTALGLNNVFTSELAHHQV